MRREIRTVTIANAATVSDAESIGTEQFTICGLITPAGLAGVTLTFQVSMNDATYVVLCDPATGTPVSMVVAASKAYPIDPIMFLAWKFVKVVSGTAEAGGDIVTLVLRSVK